MTYDVQRIRENPLVPGHIPTFGFVYDVATGRQNEIEAASAADRPIVPDRSAERHSTSGKSRFMRSLNHWNRRSIVTSAGFAFAAGLSGSRRALAARKTVGLSFSGIKPAYLEAP